MFRITPRLTLALLTMLLSLTPVLASAQLPYVWKMTYSVLDSKQAARFCKEILGLEEIPIPDPTLAKGRTWVKFVDSGLQLHFVDARNRYGYEQLKTTYEMIDKLDQNMTVFTPFMDNHGAIFVSDLKPYLERFTQYHIPYLGPVKRADGIYQLYFEIPGHLYLEFDSKTPPAPYAHTTWDKVPFSPSPL